jgi:beta-lactamase regulating signal transducer with metallopeptidase domain
MQTFLSGLSECSVAMSLISLVYMAALPFLSKRYTAKWLYSAWLVLVIGWIFPFRPQFGAALISVRMPAIQLIPAGYAGLGEPLTVAANEAAAAPSVPLWQIIAGIWAVGAFGMTVYHVWRHRRFLKTVNRWSEDVTNAQTLGILAALRTEMQIETHVGLKTCPGIAGPMLIGFFRPVILLPPIRASDDELTFILKHELIHLKRHDLRYKALVLSATVIHWFNPIVYIVGRAIAVQCELSCDELLLRGTSLRQRQRYGEALIGVIRNGAKLRTILSTNFYGGKKSMKTRIFSIMDTSKKKAGVLILCIAVMSTIGLGVAFSANNATVAAPIDSEPGELITGATHSMDNYAEFLTTVADDPVKYYYNDCWVRSLYDENAQNGESVLYFNAMEDKDVEGKTPVYLKTSRNKETNEIEKLLEMSGDEAFDLLGNDDDTLVKMTRTPFDAED